MPAPPAPTMTTSYLWCWTMVSVPHFIRQTSSVEFGSMHGSKVKITSVPSTIDDDGADVEQRLERRSRVLGLLGVVVDDRAQAVGAVQHRRATASAGPRPARTGSPTCRRRSAKSICVDALAEHQVDEQVAEDQHDEQHAGAAHEQPAVQLEVAARGAARRRGRRRGAAWVGGGVIASASEHVASGAGSRTARTARRTAPTTP